MKKMRPELPVLVMSAQNTFMTAIKASEKGAYEYLPKPFDLKELTNIVQRRWKSRRSGLRLTWKMRARGCRSLAGLLRCRRFTAFWPG